MNLLIIGAAALAQAAGAPAPFTLECTETRTNQSLSNMRGFQPFQQRTERRTQRYRVDPAARTVTVTFRYRSEAEPWVESPYTYRDVLFTPGRRIVFCAREQGRCMVPHQTTEQNRNSSRTLTFVTGQTIIRLDRSTVTSWLNFNAEGSDRSYYSDFGVVEGTCRRI